MGEETFHRSRLHGSLEVLHSFQVTEEMESDNMTGLGMSIAKESWEEGWQSGLEEGRLEREQNEKLLAEKDAIIENLKRQLGEHL